MVSATRSLSIVYSRNFVTFPLEGGPMTESHEVNTAVQIEFLLAVFISRLCHISWTSVLFLAPAATYIWASQLRREKLEKYLEMGRNVIGPHYQYMILDPVRILFLHFHGISVR